jgi:hypothetical protein
MSGWYRQVARNRFPLILKGSQEQEGSQARDPRKGSKGSEEQVPMGSQTKFPGNSPQARFPRKVPKQGSQEQVPKQGYQEQVPKNRSLSKAFRNMLPNKGSQARFPRFPGTGSRRFPRTGSQARFP